MRETPCLRLHLLARRSPTWAAESEVLDQRQSKSRPGAGLVMVKTAGLNQDKVKVCEFNRTMLIMKRSGNEIEVKANY